MKLNAWFQLFKPYDGIEVFEIDDVDAQFEIGDVIPANARAAIGNVEVLEHICAASAGHFVPVPAANDEIVATRP